ncbi:hypothetical protein BDB00DRAFT_801050, partial [Zychaea mexicana]|uniref:uncharacterized protein n=1 Tax=Zychaea mexicana TaxID=64656 RepID=UPI0022FF2BE8
VDTLIGLSTYRLPVVTEAIADALERIPISNNHPTVSFNDETTPTEMLHSQYFLVCLMSACLQQWRENNPSDLTDHPEVSTHCIRATGHTSTDSVAQRPDVALDDRIAHRILAIMAPFLRQPPRTATAINRELEHRSLLMGKRFNMQESIFTETYNCATISEHYTAETLLLTRLYVLAGRVVYFVSISNWCVTYIRIKSRLEALSYKPSNAEEIPQIGEVQFIETVAMNKERLNKMLYVLQHTMGSMKPSVQRMISIIFYRAIWGWIESFQDEFVQLYREKGRVDGSPEILFMLCRDTAMKKSKETLWPFQTALLLISPGLMVETAQYNSIDFVRMIEKMVVDGDMRNEEVASLCVLDICRAASYLHEESALSVLHRLNMTAKNNLQERLFDIEHPIAVDKIFMTSNAQYGLPAQEQRGGRPLDIHCMLVDAITTLYRLNPRNAVYSVFPMCLDSKAPVIYKSALIKSIRYLIIYYNIEEHRDSQSPWKFGSNYFYETVCEKIRQIFIQYVNSMAGNERAAMSSMRNWSNNTSNNASDNKKGDTKSMTSQTIDLDSNERLHTIWEILRLYNVDPKLVILGTNGQRTDQILRVIEAMIQCMRQPSQSITTLATECIRKLHTSAYIPLWGEPKHTMFSFWKISSTIVLYLAKELLTLKSVQNAEIITCMRTVHKILTERVVFLKGVGKETVLQGWNATEYLQGAITMEVAFLIWLNATDEDILRMDIACIKEYCKEIDYLFASNSHTEVVGSQALRVLLENYPIYLELSLLDKELATGRKGAQRHIWRLLRMLPHDSPASLVAWREVWKRWKSLTESLTSIQTQQGTSINGPRSPGSSRSFGSGGSGSTSCSSSNGGMSAGHFHVGSTSDIHEQPSYLGSSKKRNRSLWNFKDRYTLWHNCTGFLSSLAGACLGKRNNDQNDGNEDYIMLANEDTNQQATEFIRLMTQLLSCSDVFVREKTTDILSKELSPAVRTAFLEQLEHSLSSTVVSSASKLNCFMLVERTSNILCSYLEDLSNQPTTSAAVSSQIFANLVDQCASFLSCKPGDTNLNTVGSDITRIRLRFAHLCKALMISKNTSSWIMIQREFALRTKLLGTVIEWIINPQNMFSQGDSTDSPAITSSDRNKTTISTGGTIGTASDHTAHTVSTSPLIKDLNIRRELEMHCIHAMMLLLDGLPLQPTIFGAFPGAEEINQNVKCHMFSRYFTYFFHVLQECVGVLDEPSKLSLRSTKGNTSDTTSVQKGTSEAGRIQQALGIKSCTVQAIANLISANLDVGLNHAIAKVYDESIGVRSAFVQVLTEVLNKGTHFESLSDTIQLERYERLLDILTDESNDFGFAQFLCESCPASKADVMARCLLKCFASKRKTVKFLKVMIEREIRHTNDEAELLRRTTITTRLLSYLAESVGARYIQRTLHPVFQKLCKTTLPKGSSYEVNPLKIEYDEEEDIDQNIANVSQAADMILTVICESAKIAPRTIRQLCHCIAVCAESRFSGATNKAVGAFIFLRFLCPAIVSPESTHFRGKISPALYRGLLIAGKVAQNLANNVLFGDKEEYMLPLNDLLTHNIYRVTRFLRDISKELNHNEGVEEAEDEFEDDPMNDGDFCLLHHVLIDNMQAMSHHLYTKNTPSISHKTKAVDHAILEGMILHGQFECVSNLLAHLGSPPDMGRKKSSDFCLRGRPLNFASQAYNDFMRRNNDRYVDDVMAKKIVYEAGRSRAGRPVLYFILRRIHVHDTDFDSLMYLILRTMEVLSAEPFEIVVDFTMYTTELNSSPDQKWFYRLAQLTPREIYNNIAAIYAFNANVDIARFFKRDISKPVREFFSKFQFYASETDLHRYIHPKELHLPETEAELSTDALVTVNAVRHMVSNNNEKVIPVVIKLTHRYIQVTTAKRQKLFSGCTAILNDVYAISEIEDPFLGLTTMDASHEIRFKNSKTQSVITFSTTSSHDAAQFIFVLKNLKSRADAPPSPENSKMIPPVSAIRPYDIPGMLLNIVFHNMGSPNEELRHSSYSLLCALSESFHFALANQFVETKGVCIPKNDISWIVGISTKLALTQQEATLELVREWFVGFEKSTESEQRLCIEYIAPWLANLARIYTQWKGREEIATKTKEILHMMIELTVKAKEAIRHLVLSNIWKRIGENNVDGSTFIDLVLSAVTEYAYEHGGVGSIQTEIMTDIVVAMFNMAVCAKILSRLHHIFLHSAFSWTHKLVNHPFWRAKITIMVRFMLMGTFHYRGPIRQCTPEMMHVISIIACIGTTLERETVHSMMVNFNQALCTIEPVDTEKARQMLEKLSNNSAMRTRLLFGLTKTYATPYTATMETTTDTVESVDLYAVEALVEHLIDGIQIVAPNTDILNAWKARWLSLACSLAFQFNPAVQPRALIVIGCLAREGIDDELIFQILNLLQHAVAEAHFELAQGIIMCLRRIVCSVPRDSCYLLPLFWIALALVQVDYRPLYAATLELLAGVLHTLQEYRMIDGGDRNPAKLLLSIRQGDITQEYDRELGVNFEQYFSFAVATVLLKPSIHNVEMVRTLRPKLEDFLNIEINRYNGCDNGNNLIPVSALGYVAALLPDIAADENMLRKLGLDGPTGILKKLRIPDKTAEILFITLLSIQLSSHDKQRKLRIYDFLAEAAVVMPDTFCIVYEMIASKMNKVLVNSTDLEFVSRVESILLTVCSSIPTDSSERAKRRYKLSLEQAGFTALIDLHSPRKRDIISNAMLSSRLVKHVIETSS